MSDPANTTDQNLLPVQAYFDEQGDFQTFIGQGKPFYATVSPDQSGLHITDSTIDSTTIGATTPSTGVFTNIYSTTGQVTTDPSAAIDIANKAYVDAVAQGLAPKQACKVATTADITLSGLQTLDTTYTTVAGDRVLVKNQLNSAQNGIYIASSGAWTRSADMNVWSEVPGAYTVILNGATNGSTSWVTTAADTGTIGVTAMPWVQFSGISTYTAGTGLTLLANQFSITNTGVTAATYGSASKTLTLAVNAQGQITNASASDIAIAATQITSGTIDTARLSGSYTGITGVGTLTAGTWNASTIDVSHGGTGATSLTGYVKGTGTSALTASSTIPNTDITGLGTMSTQDATNVAITGGSVAVGTLKTLGLTGYLYGNDTGAVTASTTIPNTAITGLGSMSTQNANAVAISGGTITGLTQLETDYIQFDTAATVTRATGKLWWDNADGNKTLSLGMEGSNATLQIGEEMYYRIKATSDITEGQVVMFTGTVGASGGLTGAPAMGLTAETASYVMGVATENIATNQWGYVTNFGLVRGIDTSGGAEAWINGQILYYDPTTPGGLTKTLPAAPNAKVQVCAVVYASSGGAGSLFVRPTFGGKLGQYEGDVEIISPATNDLLVYDGVQARWENVAGSSVTIGTATNLAGGAAASIPYQSATGTTAFLASSAGDAGKILTSNGTSAPTWTTPTAYATVTDDTTTNSTRYPLFASVTTGNLTTEYVSSTKYQFNPSTGILTATGFSGSGANLTSLPAGQLSGTIPSGVLGNSSLYIGTTQVALNAASGSITSLAVNISGSADSASTATTATNANNVAVADNTSSSSTWYPAILSTTTGNLPVTTSSTKLSFVPSTGVLTATSFSGAGTGLTGTASSLSIGGNAANVSGVVAVANGGTGQTSYTDGQLLIGNSTGNTLNKATLTAGAGISITNGSGSITVAASGALTSSAPVTVTSDYTVAATTSWVINNKTGSSLTVTMPTASSYSGRQITIQNYQAQSVVSASSNIVPQGGGAAGTAILTNVVGNWATLVSDGSNWVIMQAAAFNNLLLE